MVNNQGIDPLMLDQISWRFFLKIKSFIIPFHQLCFYNN